jgi:membrane glycosyltransferase
MMLLLLATALLAGWVLAALWLNCGESLLEMMAELLMAVAFCIAVAVFVGAAGGFATYIVLTVAQAKPNVPHSETRPAQDAPHAEHE